MNFWYRSRARFLRLASSVGSGVWFTTWFIGSNAPDLKSHSLDKFMLLTQCACSVSVFRSRPSSPDQSFTVRSWPPVMITFPPLQAQHCTDFECPLNVNFTFPVTTSHENRRSKADKTDFFKSQRGPKVPT